uniref:TAFA chemokine like family member 5 n=1 Tax=Prolemur simus TaxID=1328070 RepID=A0A8C8Z3D5_PROSS
MQLLKALWALAGAALCCFLVLVIHAQFLKEGQLAAGTCEIVTLDRDSSQPRRTIARQTARCACRKGQIAGTTRARPACVDARIIRTKQWCDMLPCLEGEGCDLLINRSGWTCTQPGGRIKTTTVGARCLPVGVGGPHRHWVTGAGGHPLARRGGQRRSLCPHAESPQRGSAPTPNSWSPVRGHSLCTGRELARSLHRAGSRGSGQALGQMCLTPGCGKPAAP